MRAALLLLVGAAAHSRLVRGVRPRVLHTVAWWNHVFDPNGSANASSAANATSANATANATNATANATPNATVTTPPPPVASANATAAAANATNASNASNWSRYWTNLTINLSYPSPDPPVIVPTVLPPPQPKLSWAIGPNPQTAKEREAMWHTLTASKGANYVLDYTRDLKARLINASIETETILTGRHWGTPAPEAPHRPKLKELVGHASRAFPAALRRALKQGLEDMNVSGIINSSAANATAEIAARLAGMDAGLAPLVLNNTNASNCTPWPNATNASNATPTAPPEQWPPTAEYVPPNATTPGPLGSTTPSPFGATVGFGTTTMSVTTAVATPMPMALTQLRRLRSHFLARY